MFTGPNLAQDNTKEIPKITLENGVFKDTNQSNLKANQTQNSKQNSDLPASYDLRNVNGKSYITPIKQQQPFGTCWAFASIASCESNLIKKGASSNIDLSEKSLAWFNFQYQGPPEAPDGELEGLEFQI